MDCEFRAVLTDGCRMAHFAAANFNFVNFVIIKKNINIYSNLYSENILHSKDNDRLLNIADEILLQFL